MRPRSKRSPARLTTRDTRRALRLSVFDGMSWALMVGFGEAYFLADAIRLGASPLELGLVVSLPLCVGGLAPYFALRWLAQRPRRRRLVCTAALGQVLVLLGLAFADATGSSSPWRLIGSICLYQVCGQAAGTAWASWYGDIVPRRLRGRYFGRRNRFVHAATFAGLFSAGSLLQILEPARAGIAGTGGGTGFAVVFGGAALARLVSALVLARSPEPPLRRFPTGRRAARALGSQRGRDARRLLGLVGTLYFAVYIASPYFSRFMLDELEFTYLEYMLASLVLVSFKVASLPVWGRIIDQHGSRGVAALSFLLIALVPLPWAFANGITVILCAEAISGFAWAAFEISVFTHLLEAGRERLRPQLLALQSALNGGAQLFGGITGALMIQGLGLDIRWVFLTSTLTRGCVALVFARALPLPSGAGAPGRRALLARAIGFRWSGGISMRPLPDAPDEESHVHAKPPAAPVERVDERP